MKTIQILEEEDRFTYASSLLEPNEAQRLKDKLQQNKDVFSWTHSDMPEIHPPVASHRLNVLPSSRPIRKKIRRFHPDIENYSK